MTQTIAALFIIACGLALLVLLNIEARKNTAEWHPHGLRMRRKVKGEWQYRPMTADEQIDEIDRRAW